MTRQTDGLCNFLDETALVTELAPLPDNATDADDVLDSVHQLLTTTEGLHDQIVGCYGPIQNGRCRECGRLVDRWMWRAHEPGGCLMAIPFLGALLWVIQRADAIPVLGKVLFHLKRRRTDLGPARTATRTGPGS